MSKVAVAIVGATGMVGQTLIKLLTTHPWFEVKELVASDRSIGKSYEEVVAWKMQEPLCENIAKLKIKSVTEKLGSKLIFSSLGGDSAAEIELEYLNRGHFIVSNSAAFRMNAKVPIIIPEVNIDHLKLLKNQPWAGKIITNPNCSVAGICLALKPLLSLSNIELLNVVTMQSVSGAGYPGVSSYDIIDNILPNIEGEADKIAQEIKKIFGAIKADEKVIDYPIKVSAQCNRVPVLEGHLASISLKFTQLVTEDNIISSWNNFKNKQLKFDMPSLPIKSTKFCSASYYPQPKLQRDIGRGMTVTIGQLNPCEVNSWKFVALSHNMIRGAAGGTILIAEYLKLNNYI